MKIICSYIILFFFYSFLGWCLEVSCKLVSDRKFINRGFLIGPYCPIYGFGALFITILLRRYCHDPFTLFIMAVLLCSILEYLTSYVLEKQFQTRWWDYTQHRFNINGRICLETMIPFGLLGLCIMYILNPFFFSIFNQIPLWCSGIFSFFLFIFFFIDVFISFRIMSSIKIISSEIKSDSTEKITKQVRKEIMRRHKLLQIRLVTAFPKLEVLYSKGLERKKRRQEKLKKWKEKRK